MKSKPRSEFFPQRFRHFSASPPFAKLIRACEFTQQTSCVPAAVPLASIAFKSSAGPSLLTCDFDIISASDRLEKAEGCEMKRRLPRRSIPVVLVSLCAALLIGWACTARGEGGEPRYFAVKDARIVTMSGAVIENGTGGIAKGLIQAVGTNVTIPPEAWVSDGAGLAGPEGGIFPGQATVIDLGGERAGDYVVNPRAAVPVSFKPVGGFFGFPDSLMGTIAYVRQVLDDTSWYAQAEPIYQANPTKTERLPYDRTEYVLNRALHSNETVLLPANNTIQMVRAIRLAQEWKVRAVLYGGQQGYEVGAG